MLDKIEAVLFDLDGTLVDSMWIWKQIDIEYLGQFGLAAPTNFADDLQGMSFTETAQYFKNRFEIPQTLEEMKTQWNDMAYDKYINEVPLKPGVLEFLQYLKKRGIKMGIATSSSRELVTAVTKSLHIFEYFDSIRIACEVKKGKPAPDIYLRVAKDLGVSPKHCLVFEDIPVGVMAGKNANMKTCAVWDEASKHLTEQKIELADYYIDSYEEILEQIR